MTTPLTANRFAWETWCKLNNHERPIQAGMSGAIYLPIPMTSVLDVVDRLGGTEGDADKILYIDLHMLPWIREQNKPRGQG